MLQRSFPGAVWIGDFAGQSYAEGVRKFQPRVAAFCYPCCSVVFPAPFGPVISGQSYAEGVRKFQPRVAASATLG
jgi:hypothetical protein